MKSEDKKSIFRGIQILTVTFAMFLSLPFILIKYDSELENIMKTVEKTEFDFFKVENLQDVLENNSGLGFEYKNNYLRVFDLKDYKELTSTEYIKSTIEDFEKEEQKPQSFSKTSLDKNLDVYDLRFFEKDNVYVIVHNNRMGENEKEGYILDEITIKNLQEKDALKIDKNGEVSISQYEGGVDTFKMKKAEEKDTFRLDYKATNQLPTFNEISYNLLTKLFERPLLISCSILSMFLSIFLFSAFSVRKNRQETSYLFSRPRAIFFKSKKKKEMDLLIDKMIEEQQKLNKEKLIIKEKEKIVIDIKND